MLECNNNIIVQRLLILVESATRGFLQKVQTFQYKHNIIAADQSRLQLQCIKCMVGLERNDIASNASNRGLPKSLFAKT